jgi:hypothetical protein
MNEDQLVPGPQAPSSELPAGGNDAAPANGNVVPTGDFSNSAVALAHTDDASRMVEDILQSDVGHHSPIDISYADWAIRSEFQRC